uniref:Putative secreted protein n=1 Tax=Anopheles marajoara TaxID=58244 RepID=A0A2M4CCR4_9DIPT
MKAVAWFSCCLAPNRPVGAGTERTKFMHVTLYWWKYGSPGPIGTGKHSGCCGCPGSQHSIGFPLTPWFRAVDVIS